MIYSAGDQISAVQNIVWVQRSRPSGKTREIPSAEIADAVSSESRSTNSFIWLTEFLAVEPVL